MKQNSCTSTSKLTFQLKKRTRGYEVFGIYILVPGMIFSKHHTRTYGRYAVFYCVMNLWGDHLLRCTKTLTPRADRRFPLDGSDLSGRIDP